MSEGLLSPSSSFFQKKKVKGEIVVFIVFLKVNNDEKLSVVDSGFGKKW
jgi:hypothetical protein